MNIFKRLYLIECLKNNGWRFVTLYRKQGSKPSPRKRNAKRQNGCLRRSYKYLWEEVKGKGEKEWYTHLNAKFQRIPRRDKTVFLSDQCKEIEENNRMRKTRDLFKKIRDTKGTFQAIRSDQSLSHVWLFATPWIGSTPGLPVHHQLPEITETHVHWVRDAIQPSHPLSSPSALAPNPSQHQCLFQWVNSSHEVAKVLEFQL